MLTEKQLTRTIIASKHNLNYIMISISAGEGPDYESYDPTVGRAQVRAFDVTKLPPGGVAFNRYVVNFNLISSEIEAILITHSTNSPIVHSGRS